MNEPVKKNSIEYLTGYELMMGELESVVTARIIIYVSLGGLAKFTNRKKIMYFISHYWLPVSTPSSI